MRFEKDIKYALSAILLAVIEASIGKYVAISGAVPMLTFSYLLFCAVIESDISYIMVISLLFGALYDILYGHGFGTYTVLFAVSAYYTFRWKDALFSSKWLFFVLDAFFMTVMVQSFYIIVHIGDIGAHNFWASFFSIVMPSAVYNTVICCAIYFIHQKMSKRRR